MKKRLDWIDVARGIGVILMLIGHIGVPNIIYKAIYAFHMPLFFFISGLCYSIPTRKKLGKRLKSYLLPYIFWGCFYILVKTIKDGFDYKYIKSVFWYNSEGLPIESALWFLTAIAAAQIVFTIFCKLFSNKKKVLYVSLVFSAFVTVLTIVFGNKLPFSLQAGCAGILYMSVGYYFSDKIRQLEANATWGVGGVLLVMFFGVVLPLLNMRRGLAGLFPISQILAIAACMGIMIISKRIKKIKKLLIFFGVNSIHFLAINHGVYDVVRLILTAISKEINNVLQKIIVLVLGVALMSLLVWIFGRIESKLKRSNRID